MRYGRYGIEFEEQEHSPLRRWVWLAWLIPVAVLPILLFRGGCGASTASARKLKNSVPVQRHDEPPLVKREPPSFFRNLFRAEERATEPSAPVDESSRAEVAQEKSAAPPGPVKARSAEVKNLLETALEKERADDLLGVRLALRNLLALPDAQDIRDFTERKLAEINFSLLLSDRPMPEKIRHTVVPGDLISRLARQYQNPQRFIMKVNGIENPARLRVGQKIWLMNEPDFVLTVFTKRCDALLTLNGQFFKRYIVGIGAQTAPGIYSVRGRKEHPVYRRSGQRAIPYGGKGNILGIWWISLIPIGHGDDVAGMGLHGTWIASSLGSRQGEGWIRFSNADIAELVLILPNGTRVVVKKD